MAGKQPKVKEKKRVLSPAIMTSLSMTPAPPEQQGTRKGRQQSSSRRAKEAAPEQEDHKQTLHYIHPEGVLLLAVCQARATRKSA